MSQIAHIEGRLQMRQGFLDDAVVAYESLGKLNANTSNAVIIFTGLSPSAHVASTESDPASGWWEDMVGPDKPIDTNRYFVICINSLGSCFGSTGPASCDPATGLPYRLTFPVLTLEDVANAGAKVLDHLGIERVHTVLGASMGGMTALAFALQHPQRAEGLVSISSAAKSLPFSIALRSLQREMIRRDPAWEAGNYPIPGQGPAMGMRLARKLGMITYRSAQEWETRFGRERTVDREPDVGPFGIDFEIESYLDAHAEKFVGSFDANCYLDLSRAMDLFDAADHGGSLKQAFARLGLRRAMVIGVETDFLFPVHQQEELALALEPHVEDVRFARLDSVQGHDSFLVDMERFRPTIASFF